MPWEAYNPNVMFLFKAARSTDCALMWMRLSEQSGYRTSRSVVGPLGGHPSADLNS
jgi:hypothetical protein